MKEYFKEEFKAVVNEIMEIEEPTELFVSGIEWKESKERFYWDVYNEYGDMREEVLNSIPWYYKINLLMHGLLVVDGINITESCYEDVFETDEEEDVLYCKECGMFVENIEDLSEDRCLFCINYDALLYN